MHVLGTGRVTLASKQGASCSLCSFGRVQARGRLVALLSFPCRQAGGQRRKKRQVDDARRAESRRD